MSSTTTIMMRMVMSMEVPSGGRQSGQVDGVASGFVPSRLGFAWWDLRDADLGP